MSVDVVGNRFAVNTYAYTQAMTAAQCLRHLADGGVTCFELMLVPGHLWIDADSSQLSDIARVVGDRGLEIVSLNAPGIDINIAAASREVREFSIALYERFLHLAGELNARGMIFAPGKPNPLFPLPEPRLAEYLSAALDRLLPAAKNAGVTIFVENVPYSWLPTAKQLMEALGRYEPDDLRACYDIANAHFISEDYAEGLARVAPRLSLVHVSDTTQKTFRHDPVGQGDLDFTRLRGAIDAAGYAGPIALEIISPEPDRDIASSIAALTAAGL